LPKRTNPFQQLVYLLETLAKTRSDIIVTESKLLIDRNTGRKREVDIAIEFRVNGFPFICAIECRDRSRKPDLGWVEQMVKKHEYLSDKLVLVSNLDLSRDASDLARRNGVETIVIRDAVQTNWAAKIDEYKTLFIVRTNYFPNIEGGLSGSTQHLPVA
jgi:hypothetical protein